MTGIVTHWNHARGFGLIRPLIGLGPDAELVFVHTTSIQRKPGDEATSLPPGVEVEFELARAKTRIQAINVKVKTIPGSFLKKQTRSLTAV